MAIEVSVIGGGLAGAEAAYQLGRRGIRVVLREMRGVRQTGAHKTDLLGELVCSNSLGSDRRGTAPGLLKAELRLMGSLIMEAADANRVPAGGALAVDRERFARYIQARIEALDTVTVIREEVKTIPEGPAIIATGPLTSGALAEELSRLGGQLYFYDAISPIIDAESIDYSTAFWGARYEEDSRDYLNCPMTEEEYDRFYDALVAAEKTELKECEQFFEGCMPIEVMADRGRKTMLFGPLKPVGLKDQNGNRPFCACQLRREDLVDSGFNIVGFQTRLKRGEQKRVFGMIPALRDAQYLRYGSIHRNSFVNSPMMLDEGLMLKGCKNVLLAGQITGVEGYMESTATGLAAALNLMGLLNGAAVAMPGACSATGALLNYVVSANPENFQPMNINFGLLPPLETRERKRAVRREKMFDRGLEEIKKWIGSGSLQIS